MQKGEAGRKARKNVAWYTVPAMSLQSNQLQLQSPLWSSGCQLQVGSWLIKTASALSDISTNICAALGSLHITSHLIIRPSTITGKFRKRKTSVYMVTNSHHC